ncbi:MAG: hypothetical protein K9N06_02250 [Candidatus Cloacimonetes bacterium]|nr:hypothetical protein [Candidatus Cloacimonadota bacterium]
MKSIAVIFICFIFWHLPAEGLFSNPESIAYDPVSECYFVSNYGDGTIIKIDNTGEQSCFISGLTENLGIFLIGNTLYISCQENLLGYDISTGNCNTTITIPVNYWLDGMTLDNEGNLYVIDCAGRIFKIYPEYLIYELYLEGLPPYTQDLVYDPINNRLLIVAWQNNSPIYAVNLDDPFLYQVLVTDTGYFDGITIDDAGNVYISSHVEGGLVLKYENDLTQPPSLIPGSFNEPAGLFYDIYNQVLAVPNFGDSTVEFINLNLPAHKTAIPYTGEFVSYASPNPFNPCTTFFFELDSASPVCLDIFNCRGENVKSIDYYPAKCGINIIEWNAVNEQGNDLASGVYFYRLISDMAFSCGRIMLLK